MSLVLNRTTS